MKSHTRPFACLYRAALPILARLPGRCSDSLAQAAEGSGVQERTPVGEKDNGGERKSKHAIRKVGESGLRSGRTREADEREAVAGQEHG